MSFKDSSLGTFFNSVSKPLALATLGLGVITAVAIFNAAAGFAALAGAATAITGLVTVGKAALDHSSKHGLF